MSYEYKYTGMPWRSQVTPEIDRDSLGGYAQDVGRHYLNTQEVGADAPGTGEWKPDLIKTPWWNAVNKIAKSDMEKQIADNSRTIQSTEFYNWLSPSNAQTMNDATGYMLNNVNLLSTEDRKKIGEYAIGAWGLGHQQQEMHTRGLQQYINEQTKGMDLEAKRKYLSNPNNLSKQFTGAPLTMEDVRAATIWHLDPEWAKQEDE